MVSDQRSRIDAIGRRSIGLALAVVAACALASSAVAQNAPAKPGDIVVTGRTENSGKQIDKEARKITAPMSDLYGESLARFASPVCPAAVGVPPDFARTLINRLRQDAELAGVEVAKPGCKPNIAVIFVENGQEEIRAIRNKQTALFAGLSRGDIGRLANDPGPVHAWTRTERKGVDGQPLEFGPLDDAPALSVSASSSSLIMLSTRLDVDSAVVVIDLPAASGMTTNQLADYAAMRALARTDPKGVSGKVGTILALFDAPAGKQPAEMTTFDLGYLRALYKPLAGQPAYMTLGGLTDAVRSVSTVTASADKH